MKWVIEHTILRHEYKPSISQHFAAFQTIAVHVEPIICPVSLLLLCLTTRNFIIERSTSDAMRCDAFGGG